MSLNYRWDGSTYQIQTYTTDDPDWKDCSTGREGGSFARRGL